MYRKRNPVLHTYFTHQLGHMGFHRALLDSERGADFLVGAPGDQHFQNFFFAVGESDAARGEDPSRRGADPLNEYRQHMTRSPHRALIHHADSLDRKSVV